MGERRFINHDNLYQCFDTQDGLPVTRSRIRLDWGALPAMVGHWLVSVFFA